RRRPSCRSSSCRVTTSISRSKRSKPSGTALPRLSSTCWCGANRGDSASTTGEAASTAGELALPRQCGTNSSGENVQSATSSSRSSAPSPVTTTFAPVTTALRSRRQAWPSLSGALKWKEISVIRGRGIRELRALALGALRVAARGLGGRRALLAQDELKQQADRAAGRTLGAPALPGGACDVQVRPRKVAGKALQELGRVHRAARPPGHVGDVGEVAFQAFRVFVIQRHAPTRIQGRIAGLQQGLGQCFVGREQAAA